MNPLRRAAPDPRVTGEIPPLLTPWAQTLDPDHPLPEYPRPQLRRRSYVNLNGRWDYAITASSATPGAWDGQIVVPFSPEAPLSGVGRHLQPGQYLHYRRTFTAPVDGDRVLLHFGAVDQWCRVQVNGQPVGTHEGGYLPFTIDISDALEPTENMLHVIVTDPSDTGTGARGKQKLHHGGIWYTPQSGIWQTVWLEAVPDIHVQDLRIDPDLSGFDLTVTTTGTVDVNVRVTLAEQEVAVCTMPGNKTTRIDIADPVWWTPENPVLYDLQITAGDDHVESYTGLRTFTVGADTEGLPRLLLNGHPYFHAGVLDQGYWPDGLYTAPSDEALEYDITAMKDLGFTMLRKHIKIEPLRWYYHCDRLGMLVWQDAVNGGGTYRAPVIQIPAVTPLRLKDNRYTLFARQDEAARQRWLRELDDMVGLLGNAVSIAVWVPFNEGWGQFDATAVAQHLRTIDPSRPVDHASGWHDQGGGDFRSLHVYFRRFRIPGRGDHRVLALTEYGGYSHHITGHSASGREFGYRRFSSMVALTRAFQRLHITQIIPAIPRGLSATVYTQLSDVEDETNGLLTYDRREHKMSPESVRAVITQLRLGPGIDTARS
ncbi:MAG: sugar-binding domain-containing protein [Candidatus Nanopelagicales bacterium]